MLYPELLHVAYIVTQQAERGLLQIETYGEPLKTQQKWLEKIHHYRGLLLKVINQTERRVIEGVDVPATEKIVGLFEPHTDIIIKGYRNIEYGHKVNLSTQRDGVITYFSIEIGNPSDKDLLEPVLDYHKTQVGSTPKAVVADGGYASKANAQRLREAGVQQVAFTKHVGLRCHDMGLIKKTLDALRSFEPQWRATYRNSREHLVQAGQRGKARKVSRRTLGLQWCPITLSR